ncbi:hypothetical protein FAZ69_12975 [Trinickia terrae]|uniref:Uncharacterized protein n=1 Tax=Trinickia terrae TaxID=2571161 RepID=A0A4U1I648_9BURK|nr:hypothetical protein [Trinickia terrae]TKC88665.1 hypothetical protein FAZ69_12975 [Trinickia terrae]
MDIIDLARASGMQVILDGRIGNEIYQSVCGPVSALERFAAALRGAQECARNHRAGRKPRRAGVVENSKAGSTATKPSQAEPARSDSLSIRTIR